MASFQLSQLFFWKIPFFLPLQEHPQLHPGSFAHKLRLRRFNGGWMWEGNLNKAPLGKGKTQKQAIL